MAELLGMLGRRSSIMMYSVLRADWFWAAFGTCLCSSSTQACPPCRHRSNATENVEDMRLLAAAVALLPALQQDSCIWLCVHVCGDQWFRSS